MKFQLISDVHIDYNHSYPEFYKDDDTDNLILAGDIGDPHDKIFAKYIEEATSLYKNVYFVAGNHEYYGYSMDDVDNKLRDYENIYSNFKYLQKNIIDIDNSNIRLIGCTLWSKVDNSLSKDLNDFKLIYKNNVLLTPDISRMMHNEHKVWLENQLNKSLEENKDVLVITHHGCDNKLNGKYMDGPRRTAFATDLQYLLCNPVKAWVCGHTHQNMILDINNIPIMVNCFGYNEDEQNSFNKNFVFNI